MLFGVWVKSGGEQREGSIGLDLKLVDPESTLKLGHSGA